MSDPPPDEHTEAERWLREAREELLVAQRIADDPELPKRSACLHAHLAAEKALKALLIRRGQAPQPIHDLRQLARELPEPDSRRLAADDLDQVNPWSILGRYPADATGVSDESARAVLQAVRRIVTAVEQGFGPPGVR